MKWLAVALLGMAISLAGCARIMPRTIDQSEDYGSRTIGSQVDDELIESRARANIEAADPGFDDAHLVIVSFNGIVLLAGQVATAELQERAGAITRELRKVRRVHNEITVAGPTSLVARSNDAWLTTKIKSAMAISGDVDAHRINVTTENGVVYLMGLVTRDEADRAVDVARKAYGVQKIVKVFEYLN